MKKFTKLLAGVMALTLSAGLAVSAASSSTTSNTHHSSSSSSSSSSSVSTSTAAPAASYVIYRDSASSVTRAAAVKTGDTYVRVASNYSKVTDKQAIATAIAPSKAVTEALTSYINEVEPGKTVIGPVKVQMYKAGKAITTGFGTFEAVIGVGAQYNGQAVTAYIYHQDGTVETVALTVENGRVAVPMTVTGSVALVF